MLCASRAPRSARAYFTLMFGDVNHSHPPALKVLKPNGGHVHCYRCTSFGGKKRKATGRSKSNHSKCTDMASVRKIQRVTTGTGPRPPLALCSLRKLWPVAAFATRVTSAAFSTTGDPVRSSNNEKELRTDRKNKVEQKQQQEKGEESLLRMFWKSVRWWKEDKRIRVKASSKESGDNLASNSRSPSSPSQGREQNLYSREGISTMGGTIGTSASFEAKKGSSNQRSAPKMTQGMVETEKSVYTAVAVNTVITVMKGIVSVLTGSAAMFSETVHSVGDTANQSLLLVGMRRGKMRPDGEHPYGYGREPFIWALMSATGILFVGCGATIYHGVSLLLHPDPHVVESYPLAFAVLGVSFLLEGASFYQALKAVQTNANEKNISVLEFLAQGSDPYGTAILLEDGIALGGVGLASSSLGMSYITDNTIYGTDAMGSVAVGSLLGLSAVFLINKNRDFLLGSSSELVIKRSQIISIIESDSVIESVRDVKVELMGASGEFRFKAEVKFDGKDIAYIALKTRYKDVAEEWQKISSPEEFRQFLVQYGERVVDVLADEVDRLEDKIRKTVPGARHIDLESD